MSELMTINLSQLRVMKKVYEDRFTEIEKQLKEIQNEINKLQPIYEKLCSRIDEIENKRKN